MIRGVKPLDRLVGYRLKARLGSAGPTETYRGRSLRDGGPRSVAVKVLRLDHLPGDARAIAHQRFMAAASRAQAATVGGMSPILELGEDAVGPFVVSGLVPGVDLAHLVRLARRRDPAARGLEPSLAGAICAQVARVLTSAHESSPALPHLGLRPSSVRVTLAAGVVLVDFGLAAALRGLGTPDVASWYFLPPELLATDVAGGFPGSPERADLYSLGALLYFLLTGRPPVEGRSLSELVERTWEPLPEVPGAPDELVAVMHRLTAPEPDKRPASAREAAELLSFGTATPQERHQRIAAALRGLGIRERARPVPNAAVTGGRVPPPRSAKRARWGWPAVAAATATVGLAVAWGAWHLHRRAADSVAARAGESQTARGDRSVLPMVEIPPNAQRPELSVDAGLALDREYRAIPKRKLPRVPGRLNLDSIPSGADVWVDGVLRGKTPVDLDIGDGGHRVVVLKEGYRMKKDVYDTTEGTWVRLELQPVPMFPGNAFVSVRCQGNDHLPISIDDEETGRLCPAAMIPVPPGPHKVGVFVPVRRAFIEGQVVVAPGPKPATVTLND